MRSLLLIGLLVVSCKEQPLAQPSKSLPAAAGGAPVMEIAVTSRGFEPARVQVAPGKPVVLRFTRKVAETCADAVDLEGDPVRHTLPLDAPVDVKVTAPASGKLAFACPMNMYRGSVVVAPQ